MQASLVVTLPADVTSYMIKVVTDQPVRKFVLWDADVQPATGQVFMVTNKHWFGGKKQGEVMKLGFQMKFGAGEVPTIVAVGLEMKSYIIHEVCYPGLHAHGLPGLPGLPVEIVS